MDLSLTSGWIYALYLITIFFSESHALRFFIAPNSKKCLKEEIHKNIVVKGEYELMEAPGQKTSVHVTDTRGHTLYKREDFTELTGKFAFTTEEYDIFEFCFESKMQQGMCGNNREVHLTMKHGIEAKDYQELAKAEQLKPLEVELRRLEDLSENIVQDFAYMRQREEEMRNTDESTNSRVLYLSIFSMLCLLGLATWQVLYLRRYFKAKKLID